CWGFCGVRLLFASSVRCPMTSSIGSQPRDERRPLCALRAPMFRPRGRPLYRAYEEGQASLSNSYAENGNRPQAVIMVPGILELDMSAQRRDQSRSTADLHAPLARAA